MQIAEGTNGEGTASLTALLEAYLASPDVALFVMRPSAARILAGDLATAGDDALIERVLGDPALAAIVLRDANGPRFDALRPVGSLEDALRRLGRERIRDLARSVAEDCAFPCEEGLLAAALEHTWRHSHAVGCTSQRIAEKTGHFDLARKARLLGPLSDVGLVFLIAVLIDQDSRPSRSLALTDAARLDILDHLHHGYGLRLLESWGLPQNVIAALAGRGGDHCDYKQSLFLRMARQVVASIGLPPAGTGRSESVEGELWEIAEELELTTVDVAALQVHAEDALMTLDGVSDT